MAEYFEFDLDEILPLLGENIKKDIKSFEDYLNLDGSLNREIYIGDINCGLGQDVEGYIRYWNQYDAKHKIPVEDREPIKIYIDSGGGSLTDTLTIIDAIRMSETPVVTICIGTAYSGGFFIFISGDHRIAYPHATFLYHEGSTSNGGDAGKFRNFAEFYTKQLDMLKNVTLKYTKMTEEFYESIKKDDFWMTAEEAYKLGACDEIARGFYL